MAYGLQVINSSNQIILDTVDGVSKLLYSGETPASGPGTYSFSVSGYNSDFCVYNAFLYVITYQALGWPWGSGAGDFEQYLLLDDTAIGTTTQVGYTYTSGTTIYVVVNNSAYIQNSLYGAAKVVLKVYEQ